MLCMIPAPLPKSQRAEQLELTIKFARFATKRNKRKISFRFYSPKLQRKNPQNLARIPSISELEPAMPSLNAAHKHLDPLLSSLACDCHMHVFDDHYPAATGAVLRPANASLKEYHQLQGRLGAQRHVLVQPSVYGTDNRLLVRTLTERPLTMRGIAVVDLETSDSALAELDRAGVVGIRFNQVQTGATSMTMFDALASRVNELGWHLQMHLKGAGLIEYESQLARSHAPIVLDHFARVLECPGEAKGMIAAVKRLLASGNTWLKLSAPYLASQQHDDAYTDLAIVVKDLLAAFPERLIWGTDWPHATEAIKPDDVAMLDWLLRLMPDPALAHQIMVDNPAALYSFDR